MKTALTITAILATSSIAIAQSPVSGINLRGADYVFTSDTGAFDTNFVAGPTTTGQTIYAIDYDVAATTLYGINYNTSEYGTVDLTTGAFTTLGVTNIPLSSVRGMTAHPSGTWYVIADQGTDNELWVGDITTGVFTSVGVTGIGEQLVDIASDSLGNLYAHSRTSDSLYSLDPTTAADTLIGPLGPDIAFAQGMDFDWSDDTLYAHLYEGSGVAQWVTLDTTTGGILTSVDTMALNVQLEVAIQVALGTDPNVGTPFCDPSDVNSTGGSTSLTGTMSNPGGSGLHLDATGGPAGEFGYFLVGTTVADPGIVVSDGHLCFDVSAGNQVGRYNIQGTDRNSVGQFDMNGDMVNIVSTSASGFGFDVPSDLPFPGTIMAGQTWHFQVWHRDTPSGMGRSNFSNGLSVTF